LAFPAAAVEVGTVVVEEAERRHFAQSRGEKGLRLGFRLFGILAVVALFVALGRFIAEIFRKDGVPAPASFQ